MAEMKPTKEELAAHEKNQNKRIKEVRDAKKANSAGKGDKRSK